MGMTKDILNRISSSIKRAFISLAGNDESQFQTTQINYLGKTADMEVIYPYGLCGNPPPGSLVLLFNVQGQEENRAGIANLPNQRFNNLKAGEVALGNYLTTSVIKFLENGDIQVFCKNNNNITITQDANITIGGSATITCPEINITGNVNINGNLAVSGDTVSSGISLTGHVHTGVMPGSSNTGGPV